MLLILVAFLIYLNLGLGLYLAILNREGHSQYGSRVGDALGLSLVGVAMFVALLGLVALQWVTKRCGPARVYRWTERHIG